MHLMTNDHLLANFDHVKWLMNLFNALLQKKNNQNETKENAHSLGAGPTELATELRALLN